MARPRSDKIKALKAKLIARLGDGFHQPGVRFLSNRALAQRHGISYQTAHRLIAELESEGHLQRRAGSGTFVAGQTVRLKQVELWFHRRALRPGTFGAHLLQLMDHELTQAAIPHRVRWADAPFAPASDVYPVLWETPGILRQLADIRRYFLLLNERPAPGIEASLIDAVTTDDFSAGVCAAQVLMARYARGRKFAVLAGPAKDERSLKRVQGFCSKLKSAQKLNAGDWFGSQVPRILPNALHSGVDGIFCVNDRIAAVLLECCQKQQIKPPPVIGHDDAPSAEPLHLTTIGIPWNEMASAALEVIRLRMSGYSGTARQVILAQRPVFRLTA